MKPSKYAEAKKMFRKIGDAYRRFMVGRYGQDALGVALVVCGWVLFLIGGLLWRPAHTLACAALVYCLFRMLSRNYTARRKELAWFSRQLAPFRDRAHRYFHCPACRQTVRVPKGKGRISISCPKCGRRFERKS